REACSLVWSVLVLLFRSRVSLEAEILILRHQLNIQRRHVPKRVAFSVIDRLIFVGLYRLVPTTIKALTIESPIPSSVGTVPASDRRCLGLLHLAENEQQTPGVGHVERLRRKLGGCDTRPFAPLPARRPGRSKAYHERLVAMIHAEESKLVEHLQTVTRD